MQSLVYIQRRHLYYSTVFSIRQHKIADFATREGAPLPSPKGEGGPAGPDEGVSFRAADHKRAAEQEAPLSKGAVRAADWGIPAALRERAHPREAAGIPPASQARPPVPPLALRATSPGAGESVFDKGGFRALPVYPVTNFFTIPSSSGKMQLGIVPCSTAAMASSRSNHFT